VAGTRESNWHGVELRHLIALRAVAAERSFSAAARTLGYTQSAVSGQVLALERLIGARLFVRVRGTRPLELTEEGKVLLGHATAMLARLEVAQSELASVESQLPPALRVGTFWAVGALVPAVFRRLEGGIAQVELHEEGSADALLDSIERRRLDLAFTTLPVREGPFELVPLYRDPYTVVARRGDRIAAGATVTIDELAAQRVLTLSGCRSQASLELVLEARGRPLDVCKRLDTVSSVLAFVANGFGVGLLPTLAAELPPSLTALPLDPRIPSRVIALARHRDAPLDEVAQRLVDVAVDVGSALEHGPVLQAAG